MERFDHLLRKHDKALAVFTKAKRNLQEVNSEVNLAKTAARDRISELKAAIEEEESAIAYLGGVESGISARLDKLETILA
jgi:hypothetical protein